MAAVPANADDACMPAAPADVMLPYILRTIDRLVSLSAGLSDEDLRWRPAEGTSTTATLIAHTIANAEDNLVFTLAGRPGTYDREADFQSPPASSLALQVRWSEVRAHIDGASELIRSRPWDEIVVHPRRGEITALEVLLVVARHSAEHLAQAELTLQLLRDASPGK